MRAAGAKRITRGTHRVACFAETLARIAPLRAAMGITRVAEVTGLDHIGIPVCMSMRPGSRGLSVQQGKGLSRDAAMVSALMESVESFAAEQALQGRVERAPAGAGRVLPPANLMLRCPPPDAAIGWIAGDDLLAGGQRDVPAALVRFDASLPRACDAAWFPASTNGLACGNTREEALLHGLCEVIERDAEALWWQLPRRRRDATRCDPRGVDDAGVAWLLHRYARAGIDVEVWDITSDLGVPAFACEIDDRQTTGAYLGRSRGTGCHPAAGVALCRALSEAAQSRLTRIVGTRDDMEPRDGKAAEWEYDMAHLLFDAQPSVAPAPPVARSFDSGSVAEDLRATLRRLRQAAIASVVAVELTAEALGIPCVRVIAPQLEGIHRHGRYRPGARALAVGGR